MTNLRLTTWPRAEPDPSEKMADAAPKLEELDAKMKEIEALLASVGGMDDAAEPAPRPPVARPSRPLPPRAPGGALAAAPRPRPIVKSSDYVDRKPELRATPPTKPEKGKWIDRVRSFQKKLLWYGLPILATLAFVTWIIAERETKTFWIAPPLEASAVRRTLLAEGFHEVKRANEATVVWADPESARWLEPGHRLQRRSVVVAPNEARGDGVCRAFSAMRARLAIALRNVSVASCFVLPAQAKEAREAMVTEEGGKAMWEVEPVDRLAQGRAFQAEGLPNQPPAITNNPDTLPTEGIWTVRAYESDPYLLDGHRFTIDLYALATTLEPVRVYVHTDATLWRAARPYDRDNLSPEDRGRHCSRPSAASGLQASRCKGSKEGRVMPMAMLWRDLGSEERARELWSRLEQAASAAALVLMPPGGVAATNGFSAAFQLVSVQVSVDRELAVRLLSATATPPMPERGGTGRAWGHAEEPTQEPPGWHALMMARVVSDTMNITGSSLNSERKLLYSQIYNQLLRVLKARKQPKLRGQQRSRKGSSMHRPGDGGILKTDANGRVIKPEGAKGRGRLNGQKVVDDSPKPVCQHSMMVNSTRMARLREMAEARRAAAEQKEKQQLTPEQQKVAEELKVHLPAAREIEERCITRNEIDQLAMADVEWFWKRNFRRVVPGPGDAIRHSLRPLRPSDELYAAYLERWPKRDGEWPHLD